LLAATCAESGCKRRCDDCHAVKDTLYECLHRADAVNGARCGTDDFGTSVCLTNVLDSASCNRHLSLRSPRCDNAEVFGYGVIQYATVAPCPAGTVDWQTWHTLYFGCGESCRPYTLRKACETTGCAQGDSYGTGVSNRGKRFQCGC
jgi:hypothetical protein